MPEPGESACGYQTPSRTNGEEGEQAAEEEAAAKDEESGDGDNIKQDLRPQQLTRLRRRRCC